MLHKHFADIYVIPGTSFVIIVTSLVIAGASAVILQISM